FQTVVLSHLFFFFNFFYFFNKQGGDMSSSCLGGYVEVEVEEQQQQHVGRKRKSSASECERDTSSEVKAWNSTAGSAACIFSSLSLSTPQTHYRNWNEEFQQLLESTSLDPERELHRTTQLRQ